jgi:hypothetical protein
MRAICVVLLVLGGTARADPETGMKFSFPITTGALHDSSWHDAVGWHPEMILAHTDDETGGGFGVGGFLDLVAAGNGGRAAGGASFVVYGRHGHAFALSGGVSTSSGHGAVPFLGAFVGWRWAWDFPLDVPMGLRVDVRPGRDMAPTTTSIELEVDAIPDIYLMYEALMALSHID